MSVLYSLGASLLSAASELVEISMYEGETATDDEEEEEETEAMRQMQTNSTPCSRRQQQRQQPAYTSPSSQHRVAAHHVGRSPSHQLLSTSAYALSSSSSLPSCACVASMSAADCPITPFIIEFAAAIAEHPSTFVSFPPCCPAAAATSAASSSSAFRLCPAQLVHARLLLASCPPFARLRQSLCPAVIDELRLWRVYFTLLHNISSRQQTVRETTGRAQHRRKPTAEEAARSELSCQPTLPAGAKQAAAEEEEEAEAMRQQAEQEQRVKEQSLLTLAEVEEFMDALLVRLQPQPPCSASPLRCSSAAAAELNCSVNSSGFHTPTPASSQAVRRYSLSCCGGAVSVISSPSSLAFSPTPAWDDSDSEDVSFSLSISSLSRTPSPPSSPSFSGSRSAYCRT